VSINNSGKTVLVPTWPPHHNSSIPTETLKPSWPKCGR